MLTPYHIHYFAAGLCIMLGAIGAGLGLGIAGIKIKETIIRQPASAPSLFRAMFIGFALIESGAIVALVTTLLLLFASPKELTWNLAYAQLGMSLAVGCAAAAVSTASSFVVRAACTAISREPFFANKIITYMLIAQSIIEAPVIFAFIIALLTHANATSLATDADALEFFAAGITIALGCVGPSIGQALFAHETLLGIGRNKEAYGKLFPFSLLNHAIIETPMIFALLCGLLIILGPDSALPMEHAIRNLWGGLCIAFGALGSASALGYVASRSAQAVASEPQHYNTIIRTNLLSAAFIESSVIYALIISLLLILNV